MAEEKREEGNVDEPCGDRHVESVVRKFRDRSRVGQAKYGVTLERDDLSLKDWLKHLQEELMDAVNYTEAALEDDSAITTAEQFINHCKLVPFKSPVTIDNLNGSDLNTNYIGGTEYLDESGLLFVYHVDLGLRMVGFSCMDDIEDVRAKLYDAAEGVEDALVVGYIPVGLVPNAYADLN